MTLNERLVDLLLVWEERQETGDAVTPEEHCAACPELLDDFRRRVRGLKALNKNFSALVSDTPASAQALDAGGAAPPLWIVGEGVRYQAEHFHKAGGLGEVHVASDTELSRPVALKRIKREHRHSASARRRFLREAKITARLEHPGIVPVHGLVQDADGQPCYAMRLIEGESLRAAIDNLHAAGQSAADYHRSFRQLLTRFVAVCNTLAYAHSQGVIHRDLKPDNIMLGKFGETLVVDWGLARAEHLSVDDEGAGGALADAGDDGALTRFGDVLGTLPYMSRCRTASVRWS